MAGTGNECIGLLQDIIVLAIIVLIPRIPFVEAGCFPEKPAAPKKNPR
jgi:hypothetical protein